MNDNYDAIRRHAHNDLAAIRQHLDSGKRRGVDETHRIARITEALTRTIDNINKIEGKRPYSDTNIGYNDDTTRYRMDHDNAIDDVMDAINKILPYISNDFTDQPHNRQGVPGTGPYSNPRLRRRGGRKGIGRRRYALDDMDMDMDMDMDADMDMDMDYDAEARRGVPGTGPYSRRRRGGTRRRRDSRGRFMEYDDARYNDARYDDARYDDMRYDTRTRADHERQINDAVTRAAANAAANTASRMTMDVRDTDSIYPTTPVMPRRDDAKYDARRIYDAHDDATSDRARSLGPSMRR